MTEQNYPGVFIRVKATVADSLVIFGLVAIIAYIFSYFENVSDLARISPYILVIVLYDPIFVSSFGGTIGHMMLGIRVKRESNLEKNILLPIAIARFIAKSLLGWISLLTVLNNEKGKAIHDFIVNSVVIYKK